MALGVMRYRPRWFFIISALKVDWFCLLKIDWYFLNTFWQIVLYARYFSASLMSTEAIKFIVCAAHLWWGGNDILKRLSTLDGSPSRVFVISIETSFSSVIFVSMHSFTSESLSFPYTLENKNILFFLNLLKKKVMFLFIIYKYN